MIPLFTLSTTDPHYTIIIITINYNPSQYMHFLLFFPKFCCCLPLCFFVIWLYFMDDGHCIRYFWLYDYTSWSTNNRVTWGNYYWLYGRFTKLVILQHLILLMKLMWETNLINILCGEWCYNRTDRVKNEEVLSRIENEIKLIEIITKIILFE